MIRKDGINTMRAKKRLYHAGLVVLALVLLAGIPAATRFDMSGRKSGDVDAVSSASIVLPDQPSGSFIVMMNTSLHGDALEDWELFFNDGDFGVIFDDLSCIVADGDVSGLQMARRYQAQLPENQMQVRTENATLLASKAETGYIDVAVFSKEMADFLELDPYAADNVTVFEIGGEKQ